MLIFLDLGFLVDGLEGRGISIEGRVEVQDDNEWYMARRWDMFVSEQKIWVRDRLENLALRTACSSSLSARGGTMAWKCTHVLRGVYKNEECAPRTGRGTVHSILYERRVWKRFRVWSTHIRAR